MRKTIKKKPIKKEPETFADWIYESLKVLKPPESLTVTQWADKYRVLDAKTSAEPGQWDTARTPYLKGIMNSFKDVDIEEIAFVKPTQVGGTECLNNIFGYIVCQDQSPTLIVYPTLTLAEYTSKNRLSPLIKNSPEINKHAKPDDSKILELQFDGMYAVLSGANSPASLASMPIRYLLMDEVDKYPKNSGKEADPISLARERTKTFAFNKKILMTSTPTLATNYIWQAWENADSQLKYYVPCPHCKEYQDFKFPQIKWAKNLKDPDFIKNSAYYKCAKCGGVINDSHKPAMLKSGEWQYIKNEGKRKTAFHLNALYSPWLTFGDVAYEFIKAKDDPDTLMNFVNSWLGEPWEQKETSMKANIILDRQSNYEENVVPDEAIILTGGVDVQKNSYFYTIRAWGAYQTSWNISHGQVYSFDDIEFVMNQVYQSKSGKSFQVNLCAVDSGYNTDDTYSFCAINQEWAIPVKGSSRQLLSRYQISKIDKDNSIANGMRLYIVDGGQYKDTIAGRMRRENGKGSWMVFNGCDEDYANQICSEEKVMEKKGGQSVFVWKPKKQGVDNHYLDCEIYAYLCADLLHVRTFTDETLHGMKQPEATKQDDNTKQNNDSYIQNNDNWLINTENWL
jgi:phage terminase large subunit GpA-like protein